MKIKLVYIIFDYILKQRCIKLFKSKTQGEEMKKRKEKVKENVKEKGKEKEKERQG